MALLIGQGRIVPVLHVDGREAILAVLPCLHIVARVSVAEALGKDLVKHCILHPGGLHIVRQEHEVIAVLRKIGCDLLLRIEIDAILRGNVEMVLRPPLDDGQLAGPIHKPPRFPRPVHGNF